MIDVLPVPAFNDNYLWLFHPPEQEQACVVDPGDAEPVLARLAELQLDLAAIFVTHHHADHTGGLRRLLEVFDVPVYGPDSAKIPLISHPLKEGERVALFGLDFRVLEIPGHTLDHIAFYTQEAATVTGEPVLFCGDTLFAAGCGRLFEGDAAMLQRSLAKLAALDPATQLFCAHEYTLSNLRFARAVSPDDAAVAQRQAQAEALRARGQPTLPSSIALERATNPFLRCREPDIVAAVQAWSGQVLESESAVLGALRAWKDGFRG